MHFTDSSTPGTDRWSWTFGDGGTSHEQNPDHIYTQAGLFTVTLRVTDTATGRWDVLVRPSYIAVGPAAGFIGSPTEGKAPLEVHFDSSTPGVDEWYWSFGDGGTRYEQNPVYTYTRAGLFTVTLRVTDTASGKWDQLSRTGYITVNPLVSIRVITYTYDPLYRLTGATYSSGESYAYRYDPVGNRTDMTVTTPLSGTVVTTYDYDDADRLITVTVGGVPISYTWSDRGDLLSDGVQTYTWNAAGRLAGVSGPGGLDVVYSYNGAGDRVAMTVNSAQTTYVVDPFSPVDSVSQVLLGEC